MTGKKRVRLHRKTVSVWKPEWEPIVCNWAKKYIITNKWRYEHINDIDDLMQDAYLVFLKVSDSYPRVVEPQHFMSLYKTSLANTLTDKARYLMRKCEIVNEHVEIGLTGTIAQMDRSQTIAYNEGPFYALLNNGPPELKMFLDFIKKDENIVQLRTPQRSAKGQSRLNFDQRVSKLLGINTFPFRTVIKQLIGKPDVYT